MVLSDGTVVAALPAEATDDGSANLIVKLGNPDTTSIGTGWTMAIREADSGQNVSTDPMPVDLVADDNDNTYMFIDDRNSLLSGFDGYVLSFDKALSPKPWPGTGSNLFNLKSNLQPTQFYHMSATVGAGYGSGAQRLFIGLASFITQRGLAIVSTDSACSNDALQCGPAAPSPGPIGPGSINNAPAGSGCCVLSPAASQGNSDIFAAVTGSAYLDTVGLLGLVSYSLSSPGPALAAFKEDGSVKWWSSVR